MVGIAEDWLDDLLSLDELQNRSLYVCVFFVDVFLGGGYVPRGPRPPTTELGPFIRRNTRESKKDCLNPALVRHRFFAIVQKLVTHKVFTLEQLRQRQ